MSAMNSNRWHKEFISTLSVFLKTFRYRIEITNSRTTANVIRQFTESAKNVFLKRKKILFYPDGPKQFHALYKILRFLGYRYAGENGICDLAIKWWLAFDGCPFAPDASDGILEKHRSRGIQILNRHCNDISKRHINKIFKEVFKYPLSIDPTTHVGKCVMKSNWNALHIGRVIDCPTKDNGEDFVYQKVINNQLDDGTVVDMRVPIFGNQVPFVYLKYRPVDQRFIDRTQTNLRAEIVETKAVLSRAELESIRYFCQQLGLDYGEIDVLRDRDEGRIYIVDANNTPSGPTSCISGEDEKTAVIRLAEAFEHAFGT